MLITQWQIQKLQSGMVDSFRTLVCIFVQWAELQTVSWYYEKLINSSLYRHGLTQYCFEYIELLVESETASLVYLDICRTVIGSEPCRTVCSLLSWEVASLMYVL